MSNSKPYCAYCWRKCTTSNYLFKLNCGCYYCVTCSELLHIKKSLCPTPNCQEKISSKPPAVIRQNAAYTSNPFQNSQALSNSKILQNQHHIKTLHLIIQISQLSSFKADLSSFTALSLPEKLNFFNETISVKLQRIDLKSVKKFLNEDFKSQKQKLLDQLLESVKFRIENLKNVLWAGNSLGFEELPKNIEVLIRRENKPVTLKGLGVFMPNGIGRNEKIVRISIECGGMTYLNERFSHRVNDSESTIFEVVLPDIFMNQCVRDFKIKFELEPGIFYVMRHLDYFFGDEGLLIKFSEENKSSPIVYVRI